MLKLRRWATFSNVVSLLALFAALGLGTAWATGLAPNSVGSPQIKTNAVGASEVRPNAVGSPELRLGAVKAADMKGGAVTGAKVRDHSLDADDVGIAQFNFSVGIGAVAANTCESRGVPGLPLGDPQDHFVLTPEASAEPRMTYSATYASQPGFMIIRVCNLGTGPINDGNTQFNLLVINAQ